MTLLEEAIAALERRELGAARRLFDRAERAGADGDECAGGRWYAAMLGGELEAAWRESDAIRARGRPDGNRLWEGEAVDGKRVMVRCLRGYGDAVQMLRFLPRLRERAAWVVVQVAPGLLELAQCLPGVDEMVTWTRAGEREPAWEVQVELMELPYVLRVQREELPGAEGYLRLPGAARELARGALGERRGLRVGVVWAGGDWDPGRSMEVGAMRGLLGVEGVEFWSLQGAHEGGKAAEVFEAGLLRDGRAATEGVVALAACVAEMDLVVTVDTLAAHLAGAMGVPAWVLLQERADWRWGIGGERTAWYGSMRLWRRASGEGWEGLVGRVRAALVGWRDGA